MGRGGCRVGCTTQPSFKWADGGTGCRMQGNCERMRGQGTGFLEQRWGSRVQGPFPLLIALEGWRKRELA